ncbi:MAG: peptide chain release factor N(5)-glutamine methyltransferase [Rhodospirillales bacterium]|nr:peptide chain release factor N(5)-glutamine methyltransferase [Rhodospirillales bacterium]MCB9965265.1 peptide chain release factor N(5)-glutamine methyltransferase [Rhodospirillales bacterium]MCB9972965.1 peptide chain release factor N(5)-glutamine methyltransferase [Rhodospirillales bacterium]MCB9980047.1 peptide chain release factor N(5)-glutamine methyltransferase [Rhodospirillales bacterium]
MALTPQEYLKTYRAQIPEKDLRLLLQRGLNLSSSDWISKKETPLDPAQERRVNALISRRLSGEPVARIFEEWEFWGLPFCLSKETLVPRPDTETVIECVLAANSSGTTTGRADGRTPQTILDLGTGSGCILIALLHEFPSAFGVGVDLSEGALETARRNAVRNNVFNRCHFIKGDWSAALEGSFDIIVANPPYIESRLIETLHPEVKNHDPILALDGGPDGLESIRILLSAIKSCMAPHTQLFMEIGYDQAGKVRNLIEESGLSTSAVRQDLGGHDRVICFGYGDNPKKNESEA